MARVDPRHQAAWRRLAAAMLLTVPASLLTLVTGAAGAAAVPMAILWTLTWVAGARFCLLGARRPRAWTITLVIVWSAVLTGVKPLFVLAMIVGLEFMLRRQASLRLLEGRRKRQVFLLSGPLAVLSLACGFSRPEGVVGDALLMARTGVQAFWVASLLTLLIGLRLHFLRLRAKLTVTGILLGVIPPMLLAVFGLLLLYGTLGGSRANRARDVLQECARAYHEDRQPTLLTAAPIGWDERRPDLGPAWAPELMAALRSHRARQAQGDAEPGPSATEAFKTGYELGRQQAREAAVPDTTGRPTARSGDGAIQFSFGDDDSAGLAAVAASADTVAWVRADGVFWLARWRDPAPGNARIDAIPLDPTALERLARVVRADVQVRSFSGGRPVTMVRADGDTVSLQARHLGGVADPDGNLWHRPRFFGTTVLEAVDLSGGQIAQTAIWFTLQTSFADIGREFASKEAAYNVAVLAALGLVALLMLAAGLTALILSLRIAGGITGAVKSLHRGTQRLATGDLDASIELENDDEFGDLADSFNTMTVAVKKGREDALARERLQLEMKTARQIQERLLPHEEPSLTGWQVTGLSLPSLQVGGDYFDFLQTHPGQLGVAIGDVSGKGVPAALLMSNLQASLKGQVLNDVPVAEVVRRINMLLATSTDPHMFATFIYGELDTTSGVFTSANAGHEPPLLVRHDGTARWLSDGGLLLGMMPDQTYDPVETQLEPGDVLVLYTDGITEAGAPNPALGESLDDYREDQEFGEERLAEVVVAARSRSALGIREAILAAVQKHLDGKAPGDDITLVVVKRG